MRDVLTQLNTFISFGVGIPRLVHGRDVEKGGSGEPVLMFPLLLSCCSRLPSKSFPICLAPPDQHPPHLLDQSKLPLLSSGPLPRQHPPCQEKSENLREKTLRRNLRKFPVSPSLKGRTPLVKVEEPTVGRWGHQTKQSLPSVGTH